MTRKARDLVTASRVKGAVVYNATGDCIGRIQDLSIDKISGQVQHALVAFGGMLGLSNRFHTVPWSLLHYDVAMNGYIVPLDRTEIEATPVYKHHDLPAFGAHVGGPAPAHA
ncbi:MAG: PRC-barrel domain-containing protein [Caulobacterales bacterium]